MFEFFILIIIVIIFLYLKKNKGSRSENISNHNLNSPIIKKVNNIFKSFNLNNFENSDIEKSIKEYEHTIKYYYIGTLDNGSKYALIIGLSDEWVNVLTLNRAKNSIYEKYGFSIKENRWSYGSKVLGASHFRKIIKNNLFEIKEKMKAQEIFRIEKENNKIIEIAREKKENEEIKRIEREEKFELERIQKYRKSIIESKFSGLKFSYNSNKNNYIKAQKDSEEHYYQISLENQTCNCEEFNIFNSKYEKYDIQRLCVHLNSIIKYRKLLKKNKNELEDFILENIKYNTLGVYIDRLLDDREFAIIVYRWTKDLFVVTPKTNKEGYLIVTWYYENNQWTSKGGGQKVNNQIVKTISNLFEK